LSEGPLVPARDGLRLAVRLTPRARADRLLAVAATAEGGRAVTACVTAPAEDGRANEALLRLLARDWGVPRRDLALVAGVASLRKTVRIAGNPQALLDRLGALIAALPVR
jgi:hypothetical protein